MLLERAQAMGYSGDSGNELRIHFYFPSDFEERNDHAILLFFNGGAWDRGNVIQFAPHALHFVQQGVVCGLVEYRNRNTHPDSSPSNSAEDARAAIQYVRVHAKRLRIDPEKLILVGAGAGANIAGQATFRQEDSSDGVSVRPNALVMLSPIIDVEKGGYGCEQFSDIADIKQACLSKQIASGAVPMLVMHGTADRLVPCESVENFCFRMGRKKNRCQFVPLEGRGRDFFNLNVDPASFEIVLSEAGAFLEDIGMIEGRRSQVDTKVISWREEDP